MRAAVVGTGNMGRHHARVYSEMDDVELVAIIDPAPSGIEVANAMSVPHFPNIESALLTSPFEIASVCVPTDGHANVAIRLLESEVDLLIEKPIAHTLDAAHAIAEVAASGAAVVGVGHVERYNPVVRRVRGLVADGAVGEVLSLVSKRVGGFPSREPRTDVVLDLAVHDIDLMSFLAGVEPRLLAAHGSQTFHSAEPDAAEVFVRLGPASGFIQANWVTPLKIRTLSVTGTAGYLEANYLTQELTRYELKPPTPQPTFKAFVREFGHPTPIVETVKAKEPLKVELEAFVAAARARDDSGLVSIDEATSALSVALQAAGEVRKHLRGGASGNQADT